MQIIYSVRETEDKIATKLFGKKMSQMPNQPTNQPNKNMDGKRNA